MQISMNTGIKSTLAAAQRINLSLQRNDPSANKNEAAGNRDRVSISPMGKAQSMIEMLTKQKQDIMERKQDLIGSTIEDGGTMESIQDQLDNYDEQLKALDEQMSKAATEQAENADKKADDNGSGNVKHKTKEEYEVEQQKSLIDVSLTLEQAESAYATKERIDNQADVLASEIKLDAARGGDTGKKSDQLIEMKLKSSEIMGQVGDKISDLREEMNDNSKVDIVKSKEETEDAIGKQEQAEQEENAQLLYQ